MYHHHRSPVSAAFRGPYSAQSVGRNESWIADANAPYVASRSSSLPSAPGEFDLYNDDILSVNSDHKDGSISDLSYSKRDSL